MSVFYLVLKPKFLLLSILFVFGITLGATSFIETKLNTPKKNEPKDISVAEPVGIVADAFLPLTCANSEVMYEEFAYVNSELIGTITDGASISRKTITLTKEFLDANYPGWTILVSSDGRRNQFDGISQINELLLRNVTGFSGDDTFVSLNSQGDWKIGVSWPGPYELIDQGTGFSSEVFNLTAETVLDQPYRIKYCAPTCGDRIQQENEMCDDGNSDNDDGCTNSCEIASCGDGMVNYYLEQCDDGNNDNDDGCNSSCQNENCGDGVVNSVFELCDDGNQNNGDGCNNACKIESCGDGIVNNPSEECDDGNTTSFDECSNAVSYTHLTLPTNREV